MNTHTCPKCNGKGNVTMIARQWGYSQEKVACPVCKGSGKK